MLEQSCGCVRWLHDELELDVQDEKSFVRLSALERQSKHREEEGQGSSGARGQKVWQLEEEEEGEEGRSKQARWRARRVRSASSWRSNGDGEKLSPTGSAPPQLDSNNSNNAGQLWEESKCQRGLPASIWDDTLGTRARKRCRQWSLAGCAGCVHENLGQKLFLVPGRT